MNHLNPKQPIGIFDSGIGGLTIAHAIVKQLPHENIIYFGDTAHLPYGDKSTAAIQAYSVKIADMLLKQHCKLILIACSSASAAAFELVKEYIGHQALVMNVIDPVIHHLYKTYSKQKIGLIGTRQTVNSNIYKKKLDQANSDILLNSLATNLLASAIEEFGQGNVVGSLLEEYLSHHTLKNIEALILACTHYPIIKTQIAKFYQNKIDIIDPSAIVATKVTETLKDNQLSTNNGPGSQQFFVSDYTEAFARGTKLFFHQDVHLEHYPMWE